MDPTHTNLVVCKTSRCTQLVSIATHWQQTIGEKIFGSLVPTSLNISAIIIVWILFFKLLIWSKWWVISCSDHFWCEPLKRCSWGFCENWPKSNKLPKNNSKQRGKTIVEKLLHNTMKPYKSYNCPFSCTLLLVCCFLPPDPHTICYLVIKTHYFIHTKLITDVTDVST